MEAQEPILLSVQEFANLVNRTERAVYKAIKTGRVKAVKEDDNSPYQVPEEEAQHYGSRTGSGTISQVQELSLNPDEVHEPLTEQVQEAVQRQFIEALERANDEIRRVERQKIELEMQLRLHRNLLTENAESLIEKKSEVDTFRQKADALSGRVAELEIENAALMEEQKRSWWSRIWKRRQTPTSRSETA